MNELEDLQFTDHHEWVRLEGELAAVGLTEDLLADLGTVAAIELPQTGAQFRRGDPAVVLRSALSTHTVYSPFSGVIKEVNAGWTADPGKMNADPYQSGWLFKITLEAGEEVELLRDLATFQSQTIATDVGTVDSP